MKKSILFVCCDMGKGGVSKSLVSLLNCLDYDKYDVDLFLFKKGGLFFKQIPEKVNILPENESLKSLLKRGKIFSVIRAYIVSKRNVKETDLEKKWGDFWKSYKGLYYQNDKEYDVAIAYNDGVELYYVVDCIKAKKKIGYNHIDYTNKLTYKPNLDRLYYQKIDYLVTVSDICATQLEKVFPEIKSKIQVVENIVQKEMLVSLAGNSDPFETILSNRDDIVVIVSVAGLYLRKGFDLSAKALAKLKYKNYNFKWFIIGIGPEEVQIKQIIKEADIEEETVFLYEQSNPYKYVKWADIFMLTSYAEGKSIAIEEAKLLEKPILITNFSSASDQIEHEKNGLIAEMNSESVEKELQRLMENKQLCNSLSNYLREHCQSNVLENLDKVYKLWEL